MNKNPMRSSSVRHREDREPLRRAGGGSWPYAVPRVLIASLLLASCAQAPTESRATGTVIGLSGHQASQIISNRGFARTLMVEPLADAQSRISASTAALLADANVREMFSHLVGCALPADVTLIATIDNVDIEFFGDHGLVPQWRTGPLNLDGQRWVSACMFAKLNGQDLHVPISLRGPNLGLALFEGEAEAFTLEDSAYYGNLFVPLDQGIQWYSCRGRDLAAGTQGDLANRDCGMPNPNKPGLTKCGLFYAGDCGSFAAERACESFVTNGTYYRRCHTAPSQNGRFQGAAFEQVITTFALP